MKSILQHYSDAIIDKASLIKGLILDVDGVMTDGGIIYDTKGRELKKFNSKDGYIIKPLREHGVIVGAITGRQSFAVEKRCKELDFDFFYQGVSDKMKQYNKIKIHYSLKDSEILYIGDDIPDLPILKKCGLSMVPSDVPDYLKERVDLVSEFEGGRGVVREAGDLILGAKGKFDYLLQEKL